ncbi:hypothetical protein [Corallococcus macrosporus]|uniref:Lipoprotein n=1 Tax=Corallococcus macrosporus DSM 14697 TaxID=1189310 RepID=A0A250JS33_9BACT|nr:hypothetical protein [Corallococcus macrosporus]ATB46694.1 hypothetical protein MYMAC_002299 [Corallococcus macrosporus DSM 14697]
MHRFRTPSALLAAVALLGCQSRKEEKPAAPPAPATAPRAEAAPAPPPKPAPPAEAQPELSYLKPTEDGEHCEWMRQPLKGTATRVFRFKAWCDRSTVSWSPDGGQGLVFTWPSGEGEVPQAWRVEVDAKSGQPLDLKSLPGGTSAGNPNEPYVSRVAFDAQGRPVAIVLLASEAKGPITFQGESFPVPKGQGVPGLAMAYRLVDGDWKRIEAKATRFEEDTPSEHGLLDAEATLTPTWVASPPTRLPGAKAAPALAKELDAQEPGAAGAGWWMELPGPGGTLYFRARREGPQLVLSQPLLWARGDQRVSLKDLTPPDAYLGFQLDQGLLLVTSYGGFAAATVWDPKTQQRVVSIPDVYAPALWPVPRTP